MHREKKTNQKTKENQTSLFHLHFFSGRDLRTLAIWMSGNSVRAVATVYVQINCVAHAQ